MKRFGWVYQNDRTLPSEVYKLVIDKWKVKAFIIIPLLVNSFESLQQKILEEKLDGIGGDFSDSNFQTLCSYHKHLLIISSSIEMCNSN